MNKQILKYSDEIDLSDFFTTVWKGKKKIILTIIFSLMIGIGYIYMNSLKPISYEISIELSPSEKSDFVNFKNINKILISKDFKDHLITNEIVFKKFVQSIKNFENKFIILENNKFIKEKIINLSETAKQKVLQSIARLLTVEKENNETSQRVLKFKWHDSDEGLQILNEILNFSLINLKNNIFKNLNNIQEVMKRYDIDQAKKKIDNLKEQSLLAKELNLIEYKYPSSTLFVDKDYLEFMQGTKAIDKKISIIENSKNRSQIFLSKEIYILKSLDKINLVKFELLTAKIVHLNKINYFRVLTLSIFLGLILGIILVFIVNLSKSLRK